MYGKPGKFSGCASIAAALLVLFTIGMAVPCRGEEGFEDDAFRGVFTTENLDAIIEAYELHDGWYWTVQGNVTQDFHAHEEKPGWTDTAVNRYGKTEYEKDWFGCRWGMDVIDPLWPNSYGTGECYGFAQFIGYLLSGDRNPQRNWQMFEYIRQADGLKVGDILRVDYEKKGRRYTHSAVVYAVDGDTVTFMQCSGSNFNRLSIGSGFSDGYLINETSVKTINEEAWRHYWVYRAPGAHAAGDSEEP